MRTSSPRKHPLFDPASRYNQMRGSAHFAQNKARGYWDWLCVQQQRSRAPLPPTKPRLERELRELTSRLAAECGSNCSVLHALRVRCWVVGEGNAEGQREPSMHVVSGTAEVLLVREEDGTRTLGLLLEGQPHDCFPRGAHCRAFLVEPAALRRVASALRI